MYGVKSKPLVDITKRTNKSKRLNPYASPFVPSAVPWLKNLNPKELQEIKDSIEACNQKVGQDSKVKLATIQKSKQAKNEKTLYDQDEFIYRTWQENHNSVFRHYIKELESLSEALDINLSNIISVLNNIKNKYAQNSDFEVRIWVWGLINILRDLC